MSSTRSAPALIIERHSSVQLKTIVIAIHVGAVILLVPIIHRFGLVAMLSLVPVIVSMIYYWRQTVLLVNKQSVMALLLDADNVWSLLRRNGERLKDCRLVSAMVHPKLIVLSFRYHKQRLSVPLFLDGVDAEIHRQLRVRLRLMKANVEVTP